jgi:hypothetical protein
MPPPVVGKSLKYCEGRHGNTESRGIGRLAIVVMIANETPLGLQHFVWGGTGHTFFGG